MGTKDKSTATRINDAFERAGWRYTTTRGGCDAFTVTLPNGDLLIATPTTGMHIPHWGADVSIGIDRVRGEQCEEDVAMLPFGKCVMNDDGTLRDGYSIECDGFAIVDPYTTDNGFDRVDPETHYGIPAPVARVLSLLNAPAPRGSQHTPGPWTAFGKSISARRPGRLPGSFDHVTVAQRVNRLADASLIASAPALLDVARALATCTSMSDLDAIVEQARAIVSTLDVE